MIRFPIGRGLLALLVTTLPAAAQGAAPLDFAGPTADAGEVYQFAVVEHTFGFTNRSPEAVRITAVMPSDPSAEIESPEAPVPPGAAGAVRVRQPVGPRLGEAAFRYTVQLEGGSTAGQALVLNTFVQSAYDAEVPFLDFGDVVRDAGKTLTLEVASREVDRVELAGVHASPEFVTVEEVGRGGVAGESLQLAVTVNPGAPAGFRFGVVHLKTEVEHHPDYLVRFRASIYGDVRPETSPFQVGIVRVGTPSEQVLRLGSRSGRAFDVGRVRDPAGTVAVEAAPCAGGRGPSDCWALTLRQTPDRPGRLDGVLEAEVDGEILPLTYTGLVASRDAKIRDLGEVGDGVSVDQDGQTR